MGQELAAACRQRIAPASEPVPVSLYSGTSHFPRSVNRVRGGGKEGQLDLCGLIFVLVFYVRVVSGNRTGMGSQVGIEWDGQTCGIHTPRLVGLASLSVQQVNRSPSQLKNTPGLGSNPGFQIVRRPCLHGATARPL